MSKYARTETRWFFAFVLVVVSVDSLAAVEMGVALGQQYDEMNWTIAELDGDPNIVSELAWTDLRSNTAAAHITLREQAMFMRARFLTGAIVAGNNRDSDYGADDRQCEFSRSENNADGGSVGEIELRIGYEFAGVLGEHSVLSPFVMYLQRELELEITDGEQVVSDAGCVPSDISFTPPALGPIAGLNSSYDSKWNGVALGAMLHMDLPHGLRIGAEAMHAEVDYTGEGNWNLRSDFSHPVSFRQISTGTGNEFSAFVEYPVAPAALLSLRISRYVWSAAAGTSTYYFTNGMRASTRLNGVDWDGYRVALAVTSTF